MALTPYLIVRNAPEALDFYTRAFGAVEAFRLTDPQGRVGHAHMTIGDSEFMLADEHPEWGALSPVSLGGTPVSLHLAVADADAAAARAVEAGATLLRPVEDQFYGSRSGMVADPYGHKWNISQQTEELSPEELQRRYDKLLAGEEA